MISRRMTRGQFMSVVRGTPAPEKAGKKHKPSAGVVYPPGTSAATVLTGRNKACPCDSGRKYKVCCRPSHCGG